MNPTIHTANGSLVCGLAEGGKGACFVAISDVCGIFERKTFSMKLGKNFGGGAGNGAVAGGVFWEWRRL